MTPTSPRRLGVALLLWAPVVGMRFGPSDAVVRALVSPHALDPASHPENTFFERGTGP